MIGSTRFAKLLTAIFVSLCAVPQVASAINKCSPNNYSATENLGVVTQNPYTACPTGDPQVSPRCTTLTFSGPGPFSMLVGFSYEPECPGEIYDVTFTGTYAVPGALDLKYQILHVDYAPPGNSSSIHNLVSYAGTTMRSTTVNDSSSFSNNITLTASQSYTIYDVPSTSQETASYTETQTSSSSYTVGTTDTTTDSYQGPVTNGSIDHDYDEIYLWLNPLSEYSVTGATSLQWNGITSNALDTNVASGFPDIVVVYAGNLNGDIPFSAQQTQELARSWDSSGLEGLTSSDYATILKADPYFVSSTYNPNTDSTQRFTAVGSYSYSPPPPGAGQSSTTYQLGNSTSNMQGSSTMVSYSVGFSQQEGGATSFLGGFVKIADTFTTTNTHGTADTTGASNTATATIYQPPPGYTGCGALQIWQDNVYGTFMFYIDPNNGTPGECE